MESILRIIIAITLITLFTAFCNDSSNEMSIKKRKTQTEETNSKNPVNIIKSNPQVEAEKDTLLIAYDEDFPPYCYFDSEKKSARGFDIEVVSEIMESAKLKYKFVPVKWGRGIKDVKAGVLHMLLSATITPERELQFIFTDPYSDYKRVLFVHSDRTDIGGKTKKEVIDSVIGKKVCVQVGGAASEFFKQYRLQIQLVTEQNDPLSFDRIVSKDVDAVPTDRESGLYYIKKRKLPIKVAGVPIDVSPYASLCYKGIKKSILDKYNDHLALLKKRGVIDKIKSKWFK